MHRLRWQDRIALALLTPLWLACFAATLLSLDRPVTLVPFYVDPAAAAASAPVLRGLPPWPIVPAEPPIRDPRAAIEPLSIQTPSLRPGDRIVEIAGVSTLGASRSRIAALAWERTSRDGSLPVVFERDGQRLEAQLRTPVQPKWPLLPVAFGFAVFATAGLIAAPQLRAMQTAYPALMTTAFWLGGYFGTGPVGLLAAFWVRFAAFSFMLPLYVRALRHFPTGDEAGVRWARGWPALLGLNGVAIANTELFGLAPIAWSHNATHLLMGASALVSLSVLVLGYRAAVARVRRRFRWLFLGIFISYVPTVAAVALHAVGIHFGESWLATQLLQLAVPIAAGIGIFRDDWFDVDRALAGSVMLTALGVLALFGQGIGAPAAADLLVERSGFDPRDAFLVATLACGGALALAGYGLWRAARRLILRAEVALEHEVEALAQSISACQKLRELAALLGDRTREVWRALGAAVYAAGAGTHASLVLVHASAGSDDSADVHDELPHAWRGAVGESDRPRLVGGTLLVPVRRAGELALIVALGPKRNGDVFTSYDRALLAALAGRTSAVLERLLHGELLAAAKRLNEELLRDREELGRASEAKSTLLETAGHDLRQPLHAMELLLSALEERVTDEDARALLLRARGSARSLEQTFDGLLDAARLDAGLLRPEPRALALDHVFEELERDALPIAEARDLALRVRRSGLAVHSDPLLLRSILQNLLGNALRYTERGGVLLGARRRGREVRIEIWDTGPGIASEEQDRLFRAWERGGTKGVEGRAREVAGAGLGLALASRMSELLGHRLELRSALGHGSVFRVSAPAAHARGAAARTRTRAPQRITRPDGVRPAIALVDDDAGALAALDALLSAWGIDVVPANSIEALVIALASAPREPDALIADLHLAGGASGLDAIARLRADLDRPLPAIVISADGSAEAEARVRAMGHLLLRKPVEPARLRAALAAIWGFVPRPASS